MCLHCILEGGGDLVYFTRTPQKREEGEGLQEGEEEVVEEEEQCEVILSLAESSVLVALFKILLSNSACR